MTVSSLNYTHSDTPARKRRDDRFCKDCKHFSMGWKPGLTPPLPYPRCSRPDLSKDVSPVTGNRPSMNIDARKERRSAKAGFVFKRDACGPDGIFFEPKKKRGEA